MDPAKYFAASRVHIVAGKGGVGKTSVTAAAAVAAAQVGLKALIVDIDGKFGAARLLGVDTLGYAVTPVDERIDARHLAADDSLLDYLADHGMGRIGRRLVTTGVLDVVATAIPGIKDILVLGKIKQIERDAATNGTYDVILVDAPAAGHAITFLKAASGLLGAVAAGPIRQQAVDVAEMLADGNRCQVMLVTLPEETPVNEASETAYALEESVGVKLAPMVVNGVIAPMDGLDAATNNATLLAAAKFRTERMAEQHTHIERLTKTLPLPHFELPFVFSAALERDEIDTLASAFLAGIAQL